MRTQGVGRRSLLMWAAVLALVIAVLGLPGAQSYAKPPFELIYFDGHMHTTRSDGSGSVADIKTMALARGLDAVVVTDHCSSMTLAEWQSLILDTQAASDESFLALPGFEATGSESILNRDHILAFRAPDPFVGNDLQELCPEEVWPSPPNPAGTGTMYPGHLTKWVDYIHSQRGIAVHNHTSGTTRLGYGVNFLEVYNQGHVDDLVGYAQALGFSPAEAWQLAITLNNFASYGERDANILVPFPLFPYPIPLRLALYYATLSFPPYVGQWLGSPEAPLNSWDALLIAYVDGTVDTPIFALADSDAHNTGDLDCSDDNGCSTVGVAKNGLYVKDLTASEFYKALKAGRSFATTGPSLAFTVNGEFMGDTTMADNGLADIYLSVSSESATALVVKIDIIKNGAIWQTIMPNVPVYEVSLLDDSVSEDGYYRVEVISLDLATGQYYFAWSNPVFVEVP
jgi:hypothetical protein